MSIGDHSAPAARRARELLPLHRTATRRRGSSSSCPSRSIRSACSSTSSRSSSFCACPSRSALLSWRDRRSAGPAWRSPPQRGDRRSVPLALSRSGAAVPDPVLVRGTARGERMSRAGYQSLERVGSGRSGRCEAPRLLRPSAPAGVLRSVSSWWSRCRPGSAGRLRLYTRSAPPAARCPCDSSAEARDPPAPSGGAVSSMYWTSGQSWPA